MISVIIPTYNREKTIKRAIESVLKQTYSDIEVLVVDDGSTDKTQEIINSISDNRVKYVKLMEKKGACYARNVGIDMAQGEYIAFQDSDDEWLENKLEKQLDNLKNNNSDIDFCAIISRGNKVETYPNKEQKRIIKKYGIRKALVYGNFISTQAILGKSEFFKEEKFDVEMPRLQDYEIMLRMSTYLKISYTDKILVRRFIQEDSITKDSEKLIKANLRIINKNYDMSKKERKILISKRMENIGDAYRQENLTMAKKYYAKSLLEKTSAKCLIKLLFTNNLFIKIYYNNMKN